MTDGARPRPCEAEECRADAVYFVAGYDGGGEDQTWARYCPPDLIKHLPSMLARESYVTVSFASGADVLALPGFESARVQWLAGARARVDRLSETYARLHGTNGHTQAQRREALVEAGLVHPSAIDLLHPSAVYDLARAQFGWDD